MEELALRQDRPAIPPPIRWRPRISVVVSDDQRQKGVGNFVLVEQPSLKAGNARMPIQLHNGLGVEPLKVFSIELDEPLELTSAPFLRRLSAINVNPAGLESALARSAIIDIHLILGIRLYLDLVLAVVDSNNRQLGKASVKLRGVVSDARHADDSDVRRDKHDQLVSPGARQQHRCLEFRSPRHLARRFLGRRQLACHSTVDEDAGRPMLKRYELNRGCLEIPSRGFIDDGNLVGRQILVTMTERPVRPSDKLENLLGACISRIALQRDTSKALASRGPRRDRQQGFATDNSRHASPTRQYGIHAFDMQITDLKGLLRHELEPLFRGQRQPPDRRSLYVRPIARQVESRCRSFECCRHVASFTQVL